jgi:putative transposase
MLNNRAENSLQPIRQRERVLKRLKLRAQAQRILSIHGRIANHFQAPANTLAGHRREVHTAALESWTELSQSAT